MTFRATGVFGRKQASADRPVRIRENGGDPIAGFTYDAAGRRASSGYAAVTSYAYDPGGRLQTLRHELAGTSRDQSQAFTYNPASQIVSRSSSNDAYAYVGATNVSRAYAANGLNQYTSAGAATFGYDANGNLGTATNPPYTSNYVYDVENRLVSASGAQGALLVYDPLGRLFQVTSSTGVIRRLAYDGDALVAEYDTSGGMPHRYIHGNDAGADDPLIWYENYAGGWRRALMTDHQGSVIQVADLYGNPIATNSYDPWGIPGASNAGRFGYTGQTWVPELGLWYYKARLYSPTLGRFLQVDPVGYEDQINLYAYVGNDPVNKVDPSGQRSENPNDDFRHDRKLKERTARTARVSHRESRASTIARTIVRGATALGIALAINEEGEKHDKLKVYRVFGGKAGLRGDADATKGSYWTTEDPRQYDSRSAIRDRYALPPGWGNEITNMASGYIEAGNPNITTWGIASAERQGDIVYKGGAPEMTIRNSLRNVSALKVEPLNVPE